MCFIEMHHYRKHVIVRQKKQSTDGPVCDWTIIVSFLAGASILCLLSWAQMFSGKLNILSSASLQPHSLCFSFRLQQVCWLAHRRWHVVENRKYKPLTLALFPPPTFVYPKRQVHCPVCLCACTDTVQQRLPSPYVIPSCYEHKANLHLIALQLFFREEV